MRDFFVKFLMRKNRKKIFIILFIGLIFILIQKIKVTPNSHTYFYAPLIKQDSIYTSQYNTNHHKQNAHAINRTSNSESLPVIKDGFNKTVSKIATNFNSIICKLVKDQSNSIFKGHFKLWKLETPNDEAIVMIKSQDCPQGLFTYIVLNSTGNFKDYIDCHSTSREELVLHTGIQGDIQESKPVKNQLDLAISGPGFFLEKCRDKFYLIRKGNFFIATYKTLMTSNGCSLVDQNGVDFKISSQKLDTKACTSSQGLAIIQPHDAEFKFISRNRLSFSGTIEASRVESPYIFTNHLEEIDKDAGIIGPNFDQISDFDKSSCI
jgi:hypothetical protein